MRFYSDSKVAIGINIFIMPTSTNNKISVIIA